MADDTADRHKIFWAGLGCCTYELVAVARLGRVPAWREEGLAIGWTAVGPWPLGGR